MEANCRRSDWGILLGEGKAAIRWQSEGPQQSGPERSFLVHLHRFALMCRVSKSNQRSSQ